MIFKFGVMFIVVGFDFKGEFLRLLREDEEFRYAVMGLLGIREILDAIKALQEQVAKNTEAIRALQEQVARHSEVIVSLQEQVTKHTEAIRALQEQVARNTEAIKTLQEQVTKHTEAIRALQEQVAKHSEVIESLQRSVISLQEQVAKHTEAIMALQEQVAKHGEVIKALQERVDRNTEAIVTLQGRVESLERSHRELAALITALGNRYGVATEEAFRNAIKYLIEDLLKTYEVRKWTYYDSEGIVFGHPSMIDVDVLVKDGEHMLVEYKASIDRNDVAELAREGVLYERVTGIKPKLLIIGPTARKRAIELAKALNIEVRTSQITE
nr:MAG: hypothetical protein TU36_03820 [Vulcanisaeta sp. AZ3]